VLNVILFGLAASSALVIGAVAGAYWTPPKPLLASALAFASGALITYARPASCSLATLRPARSTSRAVPARGLE